MGTFDTNATQTPEIQTSFVDNMLNKFEESKNALKVASAIGLSALATTTAEHYLTDEASAAHAPVTRAPAYPIDSPYVEKKAKDLFQNCSNSLSLSYGIASKDKNQYAETKVTQIEGATRKKFIFKHNSKVSLCGIMVRRQDNKVSFPKPVRNTKLTGYYTDPSKIGTDSSVDVFQIFFKKKSTT